jgi:hypothetical protein
MSQLGRRIRNQVRAAARGVPDSAANVVAAVNVGGESHVTSVQSDGEKTVITRDGDTEVIRHRTGTSEDPRP